MHTRATYDYTPTMPGSKDENAAIAARKEMMKVFAGRVGRIVDHSRKAWRERMRQRAAGFDSPEAIRRHQLRQSEHPALVEETKPAKKAAKPRKSRAKVAAA